MAAPTQFAYRSVKDIGVVDAAPVYESLPGFQNPEGHLRCCAYSPCGRYFAWASPEQVSVIDASVGHIITTLPADNVFELGFSPLGTYIITWQRPSKDEQGDAVKNLKVWKVIDEVDNGERSVVGRFVQKSQTGWNLQYTSDEQFCARVVTNEVQFYKSGDLGTVWNKLRVEGVADFALSPGKNLSIAVFIPERKGQAASVRVYNIPQFGAPVSQKNFFKGDKVQLKWNDLGTSLIVLAQTEVDKTGKSYYGETTLYLMSANGGFDARITLDKEGPIHDVSWNTNSKEFGVVYGYMPAKTTIFNTRAAPVHSFALAPRNTILFSPHGRFVLVAGFGNLAGQMDIYDLEKNYNKVTTIEASNASVCEWSPDGKHILTATTSPRLRVDNGVRIWHVLGGIMYNLDINELYHVCWRPQSITQHPMENPLHPAPNPHASALTFLQNVKKPTKPAGAYRPPGARGSLTPLHFKREDEGGAAYISNGISSTNAGFAGFGKPRRREVPGAEATGENLPPGAAPGGGVSLAAGDENLSKAALKNKKKREAKKAKEIADKAGGLSTPGAVSDSGNASEGRSGERKDRRGHERRPSKPHNQDRRSTSRRRDGAGKGPSGNVNGGGAPQQQQPQHLALRTNGAPAQQPAGANGTTPEVTVSSPAGQSPHDKKVRGLLKKMRAIDDLKMRLAGGEKLEETQLSKIHKEDEVRKELDALGYRG
ncbi:translation initiation factor eIF-2A [Xylona heveae TC161]|uniref:Eukaryotic translation initiation factor 2A n=1 Tax=Xylona heveae (strain CBS 132557 / TC161) TaxID=1328760 RepID=A0A165IBV3_XYLHT|nr:translation initiation factor eIF-2A [Xylona heveae TC161]KZF24683.1 translation initiation factor eIF-2A [Xylona heveae TC161]